MERLTKITRDTALFDLDPVWAHKQKFAIQKQIRDERVAAGLLDADWARDVESAALERIAKLQSDEIRRHNHEIESERSELLVNPMSRFALLHAIEDAAADLRELYI